MKAAIGRIIHYVLGAGDVSQIESRRAASGSYVGNIPRPGQVVPAIVVAAWGGDDDLINGQAWLDGIDSLWLTSREYDADKSPGTWHWPERSDPPKARLSHEDALKHIQPGLLRLCHLIEQLPAQPLQTSASFLATNILFAVSQLNRGGELGNVLEIINPTEVPL